MRKILIAAAALSLITTAAWAASDDSGTVNGQAKSNMPTVGAGSTQGAGANSEDQGGTENAQQSFCWTLIGRPPSGS